MNNINILCIDPSKYGTGIFIKHKKDQLFTNISFKKSTKEPVIFSELFLKISDLIFVYNIDLIVFESYAFSMFGKSRSPSKLAEIIGIIKLAAYIANKNIELIEISSALWKGLLKGLPFINKNKNKEYIRLAEKYYNREFLTCDEVDAFSIFLAVHTLYKKQPFTDAQLKLKNNLMGCIEKIKLNKIKTL